MSAPIIKYGMVGIVSSSPPMPVLEFRPRATTVWKSTVISVWRIIPQPNLVGGGFGQELGTVQLQVDRANVMEFRVLDTYYMVAGSAVLVVPIPGLQFNGDQLVRWIFTPASSNGYRAAAYFAGVDG